MPVGKRFLHRLQLLNVLSFGPQPWDLNLGALNVLIGPNGSGKSNLIDGIALLRAAPRNLFEPIQNGGGIGEWLWKGAPDESDMVIHAAVAPMTGDSQLEHSIHIKRLAQRAELAGESIYSANQDQGSPTMEILYSHHRARNTFLSVKSLDRTTEERERREIRAEDLLPDQSVLAQRKDPDQYPEITYLGISYDKIQIYRDWAIGRNSPPRRPQQTDLAADFLAEDASNIALVLNDLQHRTNFRSEFVKRLQDADGSIVDISTLVRGGRIQLFVHYDGLATPVPATRLSDGTFRYLCLLAVLCHPDPPPLVCLEEPELGLHPDLLPGLADLLIEASERMQLIVTTHSDALVDGLSKTPESVVICEKQDGATTMRRLGSSELAKWLKEYGLGQLWRKGEIGGNRW